MRVCGVDGNGFVAMASARTRRDDVVALLEFDDSRERRSRTICGMSIRWV